MVVAVVVAVAAAADCYSAVAVAAGRGTRAGQMIADYDGFGHRWPDCRSSFCTEEVSLSEKKEAVDLGGRLGWGEMSIISIFFHVV